MKEEEIIKMLADTEARIKSKESKSISVDGKTYEIQQITNSVRGRIDELNQEVYRYEQMMKTAITPKMAKKISRKMYSLHAKLAACYLLGEKIWLIRSAALLMLFPFLDRVTGLRYWLKWHSLNHQSTEITFRVCEAGMQDKDMDFSLASWQITKAQLALSTRLIGEGISEYRKRMESAARQAEKDGTQTNQADKSEDSSNQAATTSA